MTPRATPAKPSREVACEEPPQPPPGSRQVSASRKSVEGLQKLRAQVVARKTNGSEVLLKSSRTDFPPPTVPPEEDMAARNRPRNGASKEDPDEELSMWNQIKKDLEKCNVINKRAAEVSKNIKESEEKMGKSPSIPEIDALQSLYREAVKLAEEEHALLNEEPADLIKNIGILAALRTASEKEPQRPAHQPSKSRKPKPQAVQPGSQPSQQVTVPPPIVSKQIDTDGAADSPGPSPSMASTSASRLKGTSTARSGSVASVRDGKEGVVKVEEGAEGAKGPSAERAGKFFRGAEVAYKQAKMKEDGSQWIQCSIIGIIEVGNKKRYEVQDPEPDENGAPGQIYKASAAALIAIPPSDAILSDYPVGKHVLARYPETTTFYRAEVTGMRNNMCRLKFEDDQNQEMEVPRRFVLDVSNK
ncbi:SAGA HAT/Core module component [Ptychographa xylographoides]|nr:SAGA HAT/Core module component [Ptychographa xylographoides]